jgi:alpha-tubulin suppressor-like RCC1 family protein
MDGVVAVTTNSCHSLALRADGTVWGWGCNSDWDFGVTLPDGAFWTDTPVQTPGVGQVRAIAFGYGHALAVRADGRVWA